MLIKLFSRLLARSARHQTPGKNFFLLPASPPAGQPPSSGVPLIPLCPPALNPCRCPAPLPATCPCVSHAYTTATSILGAVGAIGQRNCMGRTSKQHGSPRLPGAVPWARPPLRNLLTPCHRRAPCSSSTRGPPRSVLSFLWSKPTRQTHCRVSISCWPPTGLEGNQSKGRG